METRIHVVERLRTFWDYLSTSFWFVPALMAFAAVLLAAAGLAAEYAFIARGAERTPWPIYVSSPDDARAVISSLLTSMITMASLVFSITMVVLALAASQFGPRLIRNFMASLQTQIVLGTFVMTIVYCLLILASIGWRTGSGPYPYATVTVAIILALVSVALLVLYIHVLARSIMSETVIERVGCELDELLGGLEPLEARASASPEDALPDDFEGRAAFFGPSKAGYVQAIEFEQIASAAAALDAVVGLYFRAGDYVAEGGHNIAVYPRERCGYDLRSHIEQAIIVGTHRTPVQDPDFAIRHLVEIAVRALSPGINDPFTAVSVINQLSASLSCLMERALPSGLYRDSSGIVRVVSPTPTYASLLAGAFDQIRQNGADKPVVVIYLLRAIGRIADHSSLSEQREALSQQLRIVTEAARREIPDPFDLADIAQRAEETEQALSRASHGKAALSA